MGLTTRKYLVGKGWQKNSKHEGVVEPLAVAQSWLTKASKYRYELALGTPSTYPSSNTNNRL